MRQQWTCRLPAWHLWWGEDALLFVEGFVPCASNVQKCLDLALTGRSNPPIPPAREVCNRLTPSNLLLSKKLSAVASSPIEDQQSCSRQRNLCSELYGVSRSLRNKSTVDTTKATGQDRWVDIQPEGATLLNGGRSEHMLFHQISLIARYRVLQCGHSGYSLRSS